jgi:antirestriction protein ArdC
MAYTKSETQDTYERVTNEVIKHLEKGEIVWKRGWNKLGLPKNIITGNTYRGWNVFWLNFATLIRNYSTPYFLTYKQATDAGGNVKKGEKGHLITYWATVESRTRTKKATDPASGTDSEEPATILVPKTFTVFNIDQTEGITFPQVAAIPKQEFEKIQACETVIEEMPKRPEIRYGGDRAYYVPSLDYVQLPPVELFKSNSSFYSVAFHELAHATGHQSRLNRKELVESDGFGKELYSKEELTAEFTAAFLSGICGIEQPLLENNAAYIQNWLTQLKNDKKLLLKAATQAQRAADFILNIQYVREEQREEIAA